MKKSLELNVLAHPVRQYRLLIFTHTGFLTEQCFTSPPTQYRLYGRRFLQVKRPNQQYQSTEGTYSTQIMQKNNKQSRHINTKHSKSPSLH